jgi:hypothetical protein
LSDSSARGRSAGATGASATDWRGVEGFIDRVLSLRLWKTDGTD